jgi:hypothetical protein
VSAVVCLAAALWPAVSAVATLSMPYDMDHFREIAYAQSIADGGFLRDPFSREGTIWYNPLFAATIAAISTIGALDVPIAFVRSGPYLSALAQAAFFLAGARLVGPWPAVIALTVLLFAAPYDPAWAAPTVTPWMFPSTFAATFFYLGLILCSMAMRRARLVWWVAVGACLGAVFLAHTAPAAILGLCAVVAIFLTKPKGHVFAAPGLARLGAVLVTAILVSAPFLYSIVGLYRLRIANGDPLNWTWEDIEISNLSGVLQDAFLSPIGVLRVVGLVVLSRRLAHDRDASLAVTWAVSAAALFGYGWIQQLVGLDRLPALVPQHHFYFYLKAAGHLLAGVGIWSVLSWIVGALVRLSRLPALGARQTALAGVLALMAAATLITKNYPLYENRPDFQEYQREALGYSEEFARTGVLKRLRAETPPDAVVLASATDSHFRVAPAGRHVIAVPAVQSNPYVAQHGREADQKSMLAALLAGDSQTFNALADKYSVTHVLLGPDDASAFDAGARYTKDVREISRQGGYALYARTAH